jgi:hypothetical protein
MRSFATITVLGLLWGAVHRADGQEAARIVRENGVTYRQVREIVSRPVAEMTTETRPQTTYTPKTVEKVHESHCTVLVPVTEYRWQAYRPGIPNPLVPRPTAYRLVPHTRWEPRVATVRVPMTYTEWEAQTRTVEVPVRILRFVEEERIRKVAVAPAQSPANGAAANAAIATRPQYGGIQRLDGPPGRPATGIRR